MNYSWDGGQHADGDGPARSAVHGQITDTATGAYTVTLVDNVLHAAARTTRSDRSDSGADLPITDADGSFVTGTLTVTFDDDAPTATTHASQNVAEGTTVTGTLDFVAGADGATVTQIDGTALVFNPADADFSQAIDIGAGTAQGEGGRVVLVHGGRR